MGSPALAFREWAINEGVSASAPLEQLRNSRIAIDAEDYLITLLNVNPTREPLLPALGGLPFALTNRIALDIEGFHAAGIQPVFVFNGLDLACRDRATVLKESRKAAKILDEAWSVYDQGQGDQAVSNFGKACTYRIYHIVRALHAFLHKLDVAVITAPYSAAAQMVQCLNDGFADAVYGSASCLVFGAVKVITLIDYENRRFLWVDINTCLQKWMMNRDQFVDVCLLSGLSILPTFPEIDNDAPIFKMAPARAAMSRHGNDGNNVVAKDETYQALFQKARYAIKHPVVITTEGKIEPKEWESSPSDTHEFIGHRLPEEIYFYLSRGLIGPRVLNWRTRMEILETPSLDGGSSQTYRELVQDRLRPLRAQTLAIITHSIHRYYQNHEVGLVCWFNDNERRNLNVRDVSEPTKAADSWYGSLRELSLDGIPDINATPLSFALTALSNGSNAKKTVTTRQADYGIPLRDQKDLQANVLWRFLADRGYFNSDHTLSAWGKALKVALDRTRQDQIADPEMEETIFMAFELLRLDLLNKKQLFTTPPYSGAPIRGTDVDKANAMLISRVACLGKFAHGEIGYTGPLSRHLLAYGQVAATVRSALRDLVEMHAFNMFVSGAAERDLKAGDFTELSVSLPLAKEPDLGLGLVVKSYLDELSNDAAKRQDITKWFNHAVNIPSDLQKMWKTWGAVVAGIRAADEKTINADIKRSFDSADEWLKSKLNQTNVPNGTT